ncbi:MAG: hypothetical protein K6E16_10045 [Lachnospiraceae bacterium]|nr:hypothetical protein [Lachnospiraceae bacterium]
MAEKEKRPLFREKSMEKIESPEQLNTYIKVSNAGVWMMMAAIIVFLIGALVWGIVGRIDVYGDAVAKVNNGHVEIYMPYAELDNAQVPEVLRYEIGDAPFAMDLSNRNIEPQEITEEEISNIDSLTAYKGNIRVGDWIFVFKGNADYPDGVYDCKVVTKEYTPISFITN